MQFKRYYMLMVTISLMLLTGCHKRSKPTFAVQQNKANALYSKLSSKYEGELDIISTNKDFKRDIVELAIAKRSVNGPGLWHWFFDRRYLADNHVPLSKHVRNLNSDIYKLDKRRIRLFTHVGEGPLLSKLTSLLSNLRKIHNILLASNEYRSELRYITQGEELSAIKYALRRQKYSIDKIYKQTATSKKTTD